MHLLFALLFVIFNFRFFPMHIKTHIAVYFFVLSYVHREGIKQHFQRWRCRRRRHSAQKYIIWNFNAGGSTNHKSIVYTPLIYAIWIEWILQRLQYELNIPPFAIEKYLLQCTLLVSYTNPSEVRKKCVRSCRMWNRIVGVVWVKNIRFGNIRSYDHTCKSQPYTQYDASKQLI